MRRDGTIDPAADIIWTSGEASTKLVPRMSYLFDRLYGISLSSTPFCIIVQSNRRGMTPVLMAESRLTGSGYNYWREYRRRLYRKWLAWMSVAIATGVVFVVNLTTHEPNVFAVLLIIPLLCLRSAWKLDRQIRLCDKQIAEFKSTGGGE
jgi:hypothetical protein